MMTERGEKGLLCDNGKPSNEEVLQQALVGKMTVRQSEITVFFFFFNGALCMLRCP